MTTRIFSAGSHGTAGAHVGGLFFHFTRGDGTDYRYYVQVMKDFPWTEQGRAYIAGVEELGVTYLGCFLHRAYFRWVDDGRPEEMFSDLASQAQEARCVRSAQIFAAALCALGAAMQFYTAWEYLYAAQIYEELYAELIAAGGPSVVAAWRQCSAFRGSPSPYGARAQPCARTKSGRRSKTSSVSASERRIAMVKDKKVLPHLSSYANDPERIEEQANRMAKEGWILEKFGSLFSTYRRGKAGEYEYRVQVKEAGIDRLTYIAELTEFGIEEVGGVGDLLVLRKKADGTPFDLYSDLDSLIAQQKKAVRYLRAGLLLSLGWMSITLMNILMTLMNANVIGKYAGMAAISFRSSQVFLLAASALLLPICIVGIVDCPRGLRRAKQKIAALEAERVIQE